MLAEMTQPDTGLGKQVQRFSPYTDNGGSVIAIAGKGFAVVASETRLSSGRHIFTRNQSKLFTLTPQTVLASTGCWCDVLTMTKVLEARVRHYQMDHNRIISCPAVSQMISNMLYGRRFFPYYVSNVLAGLDEEGNGVVYSYDPVGHKGTHVYTASGSSGALMQPLLDSQVGLKNNEIPTDDMKNLTAENAIKLIVTSFIAAAERDTFCGDSIAIKIITKDGIEERSVPLRKD